jgi:hypothetical protein
VRACGVATRSPPTRSRPMGSVAPDLCELGMFGGVFRLRATATRELLHRLAVKSPRVGTGCEVMREAQFSLYEGEFTPCRVR